MALDNNSSCEQFAAVAGMLVHYPSRDRFTTFQARARIKMRALTAAVKVNLTLQARAVQVDVGWGLFPAR